jgi:predicted nucleic acid-binding protein
MGKNDIWIAATASIVDAKLVTTDKDFNHLQNNFLNLILIER